MRPRVDPRVFDMGWRRRGMGEVEIVRAEQSMAVRVAFRAEKGDIL